MSDDSIQFDAEFPSISREAWREEATRSLRGGSFEKRLVSQTLDGIEIQPLYTEEDVDSDLVAQYPATPPFTRGSRAVPADAAWEIRQEFRRPDVRDANEEILLDLERGVSGIRIIPDSNFSASTSNAGHDGVVVRTADDFAVLMGGVHLSMIGTAIRGNANGLGALALLIQYADENSVGRDELRGTVGYDPLAQLAETGGLPARWEFWMETGAAMAAWTREHAPGIRPFEVSSVVWHEAGATEARELAFALGTATEYLRGMTENGLSVDDAARSICFFMASGRDTFIEIAKLRAMRKLWSRVVSLSGGDDQSQRLSMHVRTSRPTYSERDPWVNMLRATSQTFAAAVAGAESITVGAFDERVGHSDTFARRVARNTQLILRDESHLGRVVDPAGGSYYIESLTQTLADRSWAIFQNIEASGGLRAYIQSGKANADLESIGLEREKLVASRRLPVTGVSEFPNIDEELVRREAPDAVSPSMGQGGAAGTASVALSRLSSPALVDAAIADIEAGASTDEIFEVLASLPGTEESVPTDVHRYAALWEALRDATDRAAEHGERPRCFLANIGEIPDHRARATFAQNLFQAAGIRARNNDGFATPAEAVAAWRESGADIACICSTDAIYEQVVPELARGLKDAGAVHVYVAGRPGEHERAWEDAGVDDFIYLGGEVLAVMTRALDDLGVLDHPYG